MEIQFKNLIRNKSLRQKGDNFYLIRGLLYDFGMEKTAHFLRIYDRIWKTNYSEI